MSGWKTGPVVRRISVIGFRDGFSLLELLVAVMILAGSLVVILQLFSGGLKAVTLSENYRRALFHARSRMEEIRVQNRLEPVSLESDIGGVFSVETVIERIAPDKKEGRVREMDPLALFDITVRVHWKEGLGKKNVEISTITMARSVKPVE